MEAKFFRRLKKIEPTAVELTKEDYEKRMGIISQGRAIKESKDVEQAMGANPKEKAETSVPAGRTKTRPEAIKILRGRGVAYSEIKTKTKVQLNALL